MSSAFCIWLKSKGTEASKEGPTVYRSVPICRHRASVPQASAVMLVRMLGRFPLLIHSQTSG